MHGHAGDPVVESTLPRRIAVATDGRLSHERRRAGSSTRPVCTSTPYRPQWWTVSTLRVVWHVCLCISPTWSLAGKTLNYAGHGYGAICSRH